MIFHDLITIKPVDDGREVILLPYRYKHKLRYVTTTDGYYFIKIKSVYYDDCGCNTFHNWLEQKNIYTLKQLLSNKMERLIFA